MSDKELIRRYIDILKEANERPPAHPFRAEYNQALSVLDKLGQTVKSQMGDPFHAYISAAETSKNPKAWDIGRGPLYQAMFDNQGVYFLIKIPVAVAKFNNRPPMMSKELAVQLFNQYIKPLVSNGWRVEPTSLPNTKIDTSSITYDMMFWILRPPVGSQPYEQQKQTQQQTPQQQTPQQTQT
jgi:hypothetical protein